MPLLVNEFIYTTLKTLLNQTVLVQKRQELLLKYVKSKISVNLRIKRRLDNLTTDELSRNRLDYHWPLGVDDSELLFDGWLQAGIL